MNAPNFQAVVIKMQIAPILRDLILVNVQVDTSAMEFLTVQVLKISTSFYFCETHRMPSMYFNTLNIICNDICFTFYYCIIIFLPILKISMNASNLQASVIKMQTVAILMDLILANVQVDTLAMESLTAQVL